MTDPSQSDIPFTHFRFQFGYGVHVYHAQGSSTQVPSVNTDLHLIHVVKGTGQMRIGNTRFPLRRGVVAAPPPMVEMFFDLDDGGFEMLNFHYKLWAVDESLHADTLPRLPYHFSPDYFDEMEPVVRQIAAAGRTITDATYCIPALAYQVVLQHRSRNRLFPPDPVVDERLLEVRRILLSEEFIPFNADTLAAKACMSISQLNRRFHEQFSTSPRKYWEKNRFARACIELRRPDKELISIAMELGFFDQPHFSRWFLRYAGCSPGQYRKKARRFWV
jgi:AraC-like DNA-binding protein